MAQRPGPTTESALAMPGFSRLLRVLGRAFRLRCPNCGGAPVMASWGTVRERCAACGLRFHRGDPEYYSAGAMFANLAVAEGVFVIGLGAVLFATWPDVPWTALTYGGAALMFVLPVLFYPVSKVVWLTLDVLIRPVTPDEVAG